eukprot:c33164_g1_i1 orf=373-600(-)
MTDQATAEWKPAFNLQTHAEDRGKFATLSNRSSNSSTFMEQDFEVIPAPPHLCTNIVLFELIDHPKMQEASFQPP